MSDSGVQDLSVKESLIQHIFRQEMFNLLINHGIHLIALNELIKVCVF